MENRGLLMIILSQACFAAMNVMVRSVLVRLMERPRVRAKAISTSLLACVQVKLMTSNAEVAVPVWELILTRMGITWFGCYITLRYKEGA